MSYLFLSLAIGAEVAGTIFLKMSQGLTKTLPSVLMAVLYMACLVFLAMAVRRLEVSTAYAIWSGLGTALISCVGVYFFQEEMTLIKGASISLIVLGVMGLSLANAG